MNFIEAALAAKEEHKKGKNLTWFRPISWQGSGQAFTWKEGRIYEVPSLVGGYMAMMPDESELKEEWEIIDAHAVNTERK